MNTLIGMVAFICLYRLPANSSGLNAKINSTRKRSSGMTFAMALRVTAFF